MKTSAIIAAVALASSLAAAAPASADWIDDRQSNQMQRIEQGYRNGQLTRAEYYRLVEQQNDIARLERMLKRDGHLSYADRAQLAYLQNEAGRNIFWQKHDTETQYNRNADRGWGRGWGRGNGYSNHRDYGSGYGRGYNDHGYGHAPRRWYQWY